MMLVTAVATLLGALMGGGRDVFDFTNAIFGSIVAVTGDAHQAKVAQDIFRQEIRYERSLQIREDMRDCNQMMLESVQTHLFMGSIILGVCFSVFVEGYPPDETSRVIAALWVVVTAWSSTFTLIALWLALRFQSSISSIARERLLRKHRFVMPDDRVVGRMGGANLVNQMAVLHDSLLDVVGGLMPEGEAGDDEDVDHAVSKRMRRVHGPWVKVTCPFGPHLDTEPLEKGMRGWRDDSGVGLAPPMILDLPPFLVGETLVRSPWKFQGDKPLLLRVKGNATLYVAAQVPPFGAGGKGNTAGMRKALQVNSSAVPHWPEDELPHIVYGFHQAWRGDSGCGEVQRVEGFSIFVDTNGIEIPIYKIVLAPPVTNRRGEAKPVDVEVQWNFKDGCDALLVMLRREHVHCKEEDWPIVEFNKEVSLSMPLRDYSGLYLRYGILSLILAACLTYTARIWTIEDRPHGGLEITLCFVAAFPALAMVFLVGIDVNPIDIIPVDSPDAASVRGHRRVSFLRQDASMLINSTSQDSFESSTTISTVCKDHAARAESPCRTLGNSEVDAVQDEDPPILASAIAHDVESNGRLHDLSVFKKPQAEPAALMREPDTNDSIIPASTGRAVHTASSTPLVAGLRPLSLQCCSTMERGHQREVLPVNQHLDRQTHPLVPIASPLEPLRLPEPHAVKQDSLWPTPQLATIADAVDDGLGGCLSTPSNTSSRANKAVTWQTPEPDSQTWSPSAAHRHTHKKRKENLHLLRYFRRRVSAVTWRIREEVMTTPGRLRIMTTAVRFTFAASLLSVAVLGISSVDDVSSTDDRLALEWSLWDIAFPPFIQPTAAALSAAVDGATLHLAAGSVLRAINCSGSTGAWMCFVTDALAVLPRDAVSLSFFNGSLVSFDDSTLQPIVAASAAGLRRDTSLPVLVGARRQPDTEPLCSLPRQMSPASGGAILASGSASDSAREFAVALISGGTVHLCAPAAGAPADLQVLARLRPVGGDLANVRAVHVCDAGTCAREMVLWASTSDALVVVGLTSGRLLARFCGPLFAPAGTGSCSAPAGGGAVVALTGNATHLVAVAATDRGDPVVMSVPYPFFE